MSKREVFGTRMTRKAALCLALGLLLGGCSLNPQPLPPGTEPADNASGGADFGDADAGTTGQRGHGGTDAATRAKGDASHGKLDARSDGAGSGDAADAPAVDAPVDSEHTGGDV
jgi:hypothetical protein